MKELFGINITNDKRNITFDGQSIVTYEIKTDIENKSNDLLEGYFRDAKYKKYNVLYIIGLIFLFGVILVCSAIVEVSSIKEFFVNYYYIAIAVVFILAFEIYIRYLQNKHFEEITNSEEYKQACESLDNEAQNALDMLGVPKNSIEVDLFTYNYKVKNGVNRPVSDLNCVFSNESTYVFCENEKLVICYGCYQRYDIPFESIQGIYTIQDKAKMDMWMKDDDMDDEKYKSYHLSQDKDGCICLNNYQMLVFSMNEEKYSLRFPTYELNSILELIGKDATYVQEMTINS